MEGHSKQASTEGIEGREGWTLSVRCAHFSSAVRDWPTQECEWEDRLEDHAHRISSRTVAKARLDRPPLGRVVAHATVPGLQEFGREAESRATKSGGQGGLRGRCHVSREAARTDRGSVWAHGHSALE